MLPSSLDDEARRFLRELEPLARQTASTWFQVGMLCARPLLAEEGEAEPLFRAALAADLTRWPLYHAPGVRFVALDGLQPLVAMAVVTRRDSTHMARWPSCELLGRVERRTGAIPDEIPVPTAA